MADLKPILNIIKRARRRLILQGILNTTTLSLIATFIVLMSSLLVLKLGWITEERSIHLAIAACVFPLLGVIFSLVRRIDFVTVAQKVDSANGFKDRLSSAYSFATKGKLSPFKRDQIRDTLKRMEGLDIKKATPFSIPRDIKVLVILIISTTGVLLLKVPESQPAHIPTKNIEDVTPVITHPPILNESDMLFEKERLKELKKLAEESKDPEVMEMVKELEKLMEELDEKKITENEFLERLQSIEDKYIQDCDDVDAVAVMQELIELSPYFKDSEKTKTLQNILKEKDLSAARDELDRLSDDAIKGNAIGEGLRVEQFYAAVDNIRARYLICDKEELDKLSDSLKKAAKDLEKNKQTKDLAKALKDGDLEKAAKELEKLADKIAKGELSKKEVEALAKKLEKLAKLLDPQDLEKLAKMMKLDKKIAGLEKKLKKRGKLGKKDKKKLGKNQENKKKLQRELDKEDRDPHQKDLKELSKNMKELSRQAKEDEKSGRNDEARNEKKESEKLERELKELRKKQDKLERQMEKKQSSKLERKLKELKRRQEELEQKQQEQQNQQNQQDQQGKMSQQEQRDQQNQEGQKDQQNQQGQKDQQNQQGQQRQQQQRNQQGQQGKQQSKTQQQAKQTGEQLKKMGQKQKSGEAKEKGKEQTGDLREQARRNGHNPSKDDDGVHKQMDDFLNIAEGQEPGHKKDHNGQNEGQLKPPEKGEIPQDNQQQGNNSNNRNNRVENESLGQGIGTGHKDALGEETSMDAEHYKTKVDGVDGEGGSSTEVIKGASEKGFADTEYREVYEEYSKVLEETLDAENVPAGYRFYVRRYFQLIRPRD